MRGLLGEDAPVSASHGGPVEVQAGTMSLPNGAAGPWMTSKWSYMWVDGVYVKAGLEKEKAAVLVVMAALSDGEQGGGEHCSGYRESTESWPRCSGTSSAGA